MATRSYIVVIGMLLAGYLLSGCQTETISTYVAPKDPIKQQRVSDLGEHAIPLQWTAPERWDEHVASGMRLASFSRRTPHGIVDISLIKLSGQAGGLAANVNRWRGQIGLSPQSKHVIEESVTRHQSHRLPVARVALVGERESILAAIIHHHDAQWFFKARGKLRAIETMEVEFDDFVKSVRAVRGGAQ